MHTYLLTDFMQAYKYTHPQTHKNAHHTTAQNYMQIARAHLHLHTDRARTVTPSHIRTTDRCACTHACTPTRKRTHSHMFTKMCTNMHDPQTYADKRLKR